MSRSLICRIALRWSFGAIVLLVGGERSAAQTRPSFSQQIFLLKQLNPSLKSVGVMARTMKEEELDALVRAGMGQGITIAVAMPKNPQEIPGLSRRLIAERKVEMILLPFADDELMNGIGFEYLREQALNNKVGLCVASERLVAGGALCSMDATPGKIVVHVNARIAEALGIRVPQDQQPTVAYLAR